MFGSNLSLDLILAFSILGDLVLLVEPAYDARNPSISFAREEFENLGKESVRYSERLENLFRQLFIHG